MNIFASDKAPYALVLVLTILGWHVSQLTAEIRATRAVSYSVDINRATGEVTATVRNVSKTHSLAGAEFALACPAGVSCLAGRGNTAPRHVSINVSPPNAPTAAQVVVDDAREISVRTTLAAGGVFQFAGRLARPADQVSFFFKPDPERPQDIYIYNSDSMMGFVVEHYFELVLISFLTLLAVLLVVLAISTVRYLAGRREKSTEGCDVENDQAAVAAGARPSASGAKL